MSGVLFIAALLFCYVQSNKRVPTGMIRLEEREIDLEERLLAVEADIEQNMTAEEIDDYFSRLNQQQLQREEDRRRSGN